MPKIFRTLPFTAMVLVWMSTAFAGPAPGQVKPEDFYKGATIMFRGGTGPGTPTDIMMRGLGPGLKKYTGANVVIELDEAGKHPAVATHLYKTAKRDGLTIAMVPGDILAREVLGDPVIKFSAKALNFLVKPVMPLRMFSASKASGLTSMRDMQKAAKPIRAGMTRVGSSAHLAQSAIAEAFGLNMKMVAGYKSAAAIMLALAAGREIDTASQGVLAAYMEMEKRGEIVWIAQITSNKSRSPLFPKVPTVNELAAVSAEGKKALDFFIASDELYYLVTAPPGVPKERLAYLEKALMASIEGPAFKKVMEREVMDIVAQPGKEVTALFEKLLKIHPKELSAIKHILTKKYE